MSTTPEQCLADVPDVLHGIVHAYWQDWSEACAAAGINDAIALPVMGKIWACSDFAALVCTRQPAFLHSLLDEGVESDRSQADYCALVSAAIEQAVAGMVSEVAAEAALMRALRELRQREMLRIVIRDIGEIASLEQILAELSAFAEAMVSVTLAHLHQAATAQLGEPLDDDGRSQQLLVLGMGKLGGAELNFSSDIDLIFCYPEDGQTRGGRSLSIHEFFVRLAQKLIRALNEITADGFVFRVDARLRPFGDSGPLVMSFAALEQYYQSQGRDWERYAMVKARAIAGDSADIDYLDKLLRPFVYRRYLDFSAIASIREMKDMIEAEVRRKGIADNVKLGRGGIREIEFIGQTFQLIRGGRDRALQIRSILRVLRVLVDLNCLEADEAEKLDQSYRFLRRLENRIQMLRDQQTHVVPKSDIDRARLALAMGQADWPALEAEITLMRAQVSDIFRSIVSDSADTPKPQAALQAFWRKPKDDTAMQHWLAELGYTEGAEIAQQLARFSRQAQITQLGEAASGRLQLLLTSLLAEIVVYPDPAKLLERMLDLLRAIVGRAVYINLLLEYAVVREQMLKLCAASDWFARQLTSNPLLLDELLDVGELYQVADRAGIAQELDYMISAVPEVDLEQVMDRLRLFRNAHLLRTAAQDVSGVIDVMGVGDVLSYVAEVILERTLQLAWNEMVLRYGEPQCSVDGEIRKPGMAIVGYGKLGGYELGYSSDLDIVFLHNSQGEAEYTSGEKSIDNSNFFARVAQRALHILGTRTYAGLLYETDTRLRPDGRAGLMVSSLTGFEDYQHNKAWTWEHQALIRARVVAGDDHVREEFDRIRHSVLSQAHEPGVLFSAVAEMRAKMREHLGSKGGQAINLKQDAGGIVDIEFITQAGVLLNAAQHGTLLESTSTLVLLAGLEKIGWLQTAEVELMQTAYKLYRQQLNHRALQVELSADQTASIEQHRQQVSNIWQRLFAETETAG